MACLMSPLPKEGTIVDATIIESGQASTENKQRKRLWNATRLKRVSSGSLALKAHIGGWR